MDPLKTYHKGIRDSTYRMLRTITSLKEMQYAHCQQKAWVGIEKTHLRLLQCRELTTKWNNYTRLTQPSVSGTVESPRMHVETHWPSWQHRTKSMKHAVNWPALTPQFSAAAQEVLLQWSGLTTHRLEPWWVLDIRIIFSPKTKSTQITLSEINPFCILFQMSLSLYFDDHHTARELSEHRQFCKFLKVLVFIVLRLPVSRLPYFSFTLTINNINNICSCIAFTKVSIAVKNVQILLWKATKPILKHQQL